MKSKFILGLALCLVYKLTLGQDVGLLTQFNGRYDYTAIGNSLNLAENGSGAACEIRSSATADLNLDPDQTVVLALLYWAGSGSGDFEIKFNGIDIVPDRTFSQALDDERQFFAAVTDVSSQVRETGNGRYTLSELDLSDIIDIYCPTGTNFAGWSLIIIFEDPDLPLNQLNIYEGLERVPEAISINLESLNVLDDQGAKIGFLAWEGDQAISVTEALSINGDIISNPPLNPADNAFNGTNSFTESTGLFNMDIDFYDIEDNIEPGDTSALIELSSGQDFVMINNIITVLNSQLPDATASLDSVSDPQCGSRELLVAFTIYNINSTDVLPAATPIAFFADETLLSTSATLADIPIDGSESQTIVLNIPDGIPATFTLRISADNTGSNSGIVAEILEDNNDDQLAVRLLLLPAVNPLNDLQCCRAVGKQRFDLTSVASEIDASLQISFHLSEAEAEAAENPIETPEDYLPISNPQTIYLRVENADCFVVESFEIEVIICPLPDATISLATQLIACRQRNLELPLRISNLDATASLPANVPVTIYGDGEVLLIFDTPVSIPIGGFYETVVTLSLPTELPDSFSLMAVVDDLGNGIGVVEELDETNNTFKSIVEFKSIPPLPTIPNQLLCDLGFDRAVFDLSALTSEFWSDLMGTVSFYESEADAITATNAIVGANSYQNQSNPQQIYARLDTAICFEISSFSIEVENCPPVIPQGFSPNNDGINDRFEIVGLLDIFPDHRLEIYSRMGNLIFVGTNQTRHWNGIPNKGLPKQENIVPDGVYYYVLYLNDPTYNSLAGWLYLNRE